MRSRVWPATLAGFSMCTALAGFSITIGTTADAAAPQREAAGGAVSDREVNFDIPAQPLAGALLAFSAQTGLQVLTSGTTLPSGDTSAITGRFTITRALSALLDGTGLQYRTVSDTTITLVPSGRPLQGNEAPVSGDLHLAQSDAEKSQSGVEEVVVYSERTGYAATDASGATKTDTPIIETPQSSSIVTRNQLDDRGVNSLTDALHYAAGVRTDEASGAGVTQDNFYVRGFSESGVGSYVDGLRQSYEPINGAAKIYGVERVEVLRGPSSVLYGQNDPGGLVNLVSKRPGETPVHQVDLTLGRYDRRQIGVDHGGAVDGEGKLLYRGVGLFRDSNTETRFVPDDALYIAPSLLWKPADAVRLTLLTGYERDESRFSYGLPPFGSVLPNPNGELPWDFFGGDPSYSDKKVRRYWAGYELLAHLKGAWTFTQNTRYSNIDVDDYRLGPRGNYSVPFGDPRFGSALAEDDRTLLRSAQAYLYGINMFQTDNHLAAKFGDDDLQQTVLVGIDYASIHSNSDLYSGIAPSLDLFSPAYHQAVGDPALDLTSRILLRQTGVYAQDQLKIAGKWVLLVGARQDHATLQQDSTLYYLDPPLPVPNRRKDDKLTYRAGLVYLAGSGIAPYVNYSTSFLPSTETDVDNNTFEPTTGRQVEAGVKYKPAGFDGFITAALFRVNKRNLAVDDPDNPGFLIQIGEVRSQGLELEGVANLDDRLDLIGSYSWTDMEVLDATDGSIGKRPTNVPKHMGSLWVAYKLNGKDRPGLRIGAGVHHVGPTFGDALNTIDIPGYTLADASLSYEIPHYMLSLNVNNIADKHYLFSYTGFNYSFFGTGRTWTASLRYLW